MDQSRENKLNITLKTFFGFEEVLAEELKELGFPKSELLNRAVRIQGTLKDVYFLNLNVRCAITVLVEVDRFRINQEDDLYKRAMRIPWTDYFTLDKSFAVKGAIFSDFFKHSQFPFLLVKDAIVDTFRKELNDRPDVNVRSPQVVFDLYINNKEVTISLNTSGVPLFQRGYRQDVGLAPLNEVVAAGLIRLSGWDKKSTFVDPFCGSGTLLIEAAMMAAGVPPAMERQHFAFKNFKDFDAGLWDEVQSAIPRRITELPCEIIGSDKNAEMVTKTRRNLRGLPIGRFVKTSVEDFNKTGPYEGTGVMISNPPYGERMGEEIEELYGEIGDWMKSTMQGFDCWLISANADAFKHVGLRPERKLKLYNGNLECSFRKYGIYEGSKKMKHQSTSEEVSLEVDPNELESKKSGQLPPVDGAKVEKKIAVEPNPTTVVANEEEVIEKKVKEESKVNLKPEKNETRSKSSKENIAKEKTSPEQIVDEPKEAPKEIIDKPKKQSKYRKAPVSKSVKEASREESVPHTENKPDLKKESEVSDVNPTEPKTEDTVPEKKEKGKSERRISSKYGRKPDSEE